MQRSFSCIVCLVALAAACAPQEPAPALSPSEATVQGPAESTKTCGTDDDCVLTSVQGEDCCTQWCEPAAMTKAKQRAIQTARAEKCSSVVCNPSPPSPCPPLRWARPVARCVERACTIVDAARPAPR